MRLGRRFDRSTVSAVLGREAIVRKRKAFMLDGVLDRLFALLLLLLLLSLLLSQGMLLLVSSVRARKCCTIYR